MLEDTRNTHSKLDMDFKSTYPDDFFLLFGMGKDLDLEEPMEVEFKLDRDIEWLE